MVGISGLVKKGQRQETAAPEPPLGRWLQVPAQRAALMWLRATGVEGRAREGAGAEPLGAAVGIETSYLKERYRGEFEQALKEALERVSDRERILLRLHLVNGL